MSSARTGLHHNRQRARLAAVVVALAVLVPPVTAVAQEEFYKGKQIRLIIGSGTGGGYDAYGRLLAAHLARHIPGQPTIIVQNMDGAGALVLANYLANIAAGDATVIGGVNPLVATHPLFKSEQAKYDARKLGWIGSLLGETYVGIAWHTAPIKGFKDALEHELVVAGSGGATTNYPPFINAVSGSKFKLVAGYKGTNQAMLAMERGEVTGLVGTTWGSLKAQSASLLKEGKIRVFVQFSRERHPDLTDVPSIYDIVTREDDRMAMDLMFVVQQVGRAYVMPPGVPESLLETMRTAFDRTVKDPEFLADAQRRGIDLEPQPGTAVQALVANIYKSSPATIDRVKEFLKN
jgi:tripartite-type tricarboxylate transporter receptor subunit TctC